MIVTSCEPRGSAEAVQGIYPGLESNALIYCSKGILMLGSWATNTKLWLPQYSLDVPDDQTQDETCQRMAISLGQIDITPTVVAMLPDTMGEDDTSGATVKLLRLMVARAVTPENLSSNRSDCFQRVWQNRQELAQGLMEGRFTLKTEHILRQTIFSGEPIDLGAPIPRVQLVA